MRINKTKLKLFTSALSLMAALAVAFCQLLHPCYHMHHSDDGDGAELIKIEANEKFASVEGDSFCPVCSGLFHFCADLQEITLPQAVYPELFPAQAHSVSVVRIIQLLSRGPPCCNALPLNRI